MAVLSGRESRLTLKPMPAEFWQTTRGFWAVNCFADLPQLEVTSQFLICGVIVHWPAMTYRDCPVSENPVLPPCDTVVGYVISHGHTVCSGERMTGVTHSKKASTDADTRDALSRMERDWDLRAREAPEYYIASARRQWRMDEFFQGVFRGQDTKHRNSWPKKTAGKRA